MRLGRPKVALILTDDERQRSDSLAHRSRSAPAIARRARIILACAEGTDSKVVARRLKVTPGTVCKWRGRFVTDRLDGLYDEPRPGAERTITDAQIEDVIIRTLETTPRGATHWSTRDMAKAVGLSHMAISRIWRAFALQPHRSETFKLSNDPQLVEKIRDIVGLYLDPPAHAAVFCVDEKPQIQALERTQPLLPLQPGQIERRTHDYKRHGTTTLFAALNAKTSEVITQFHQRHRSAQFREFLDLIDARVPAPLGRAHHHGQLRHPQNGVDPELVCQAPALSRPLHADVWIVAQSRGTLVRRADDETDPPRHVPERAAAQNRYSGIHRRASGQPETVRLDEKRRRDPGEHRSLRAAHCRCPGRELMSRIHGYGTLGGQRRTNGGARD